jgi:hypothetical protein
MISRRTVGLGAVALVGIAAIGRAPAAFAQAGGANLNISPKRVVFDPQTRSTTVYIFNRGSEPATYAIDLVDRAMTADGQIRAVSEVAKTADSAVAARVKSAKSMLVFSPRRVTLAGGGSQVVRLQVLRPGDLPPGEYRSHLTVTELPAENTGLTAEQAATGENGQLSVVINALFAISIPIIVRQGPPDIRAAIDGVSYAVRAAGPSAPAGAPAKTGVVTLQLIRQGDSSIFGDIEVRALKNGKPDQVIGGLRGIGVYPEIDRRSVEVTLNRLAAAGEPLEVIFRDEDAKPGVYLASARFTAT